MNVLEAGILKLDEQAGEVEIMAGIGQGYNQGHASMKMKTVTYKNWTFEVDYDRNKVVYENIIVVDDERCACANCRNFSANRENLYPQEIKELLTALGIDYKKEIEVYQIAKLENGLHQYVGWFNFKGRIIEGKDGKVELPHARWTLDLEKVEGSFSIAFMKGAALHQFSGHEKDDLLQIKFMVESEWVIDKELESS